MNLGIAAVAGGLIVARVITSGAQPTFERDRLKTAAGDLEIVCIGHGTLMFAFGDKIIHVDPVGKLADFTKLPKADIILITHEHGDHLDLEAIETLRTEKTELVMTESCAKKIEPGLVMKNGDVRTVQGLKIQAVPAYNIVNIRPSGEPYHPKGVGNGYVITFADKRVYVAGDTENIPELKRLKDIDIAFLPMNLPYTMLPAMLADAATMFNPRILYPYHTGDTDVTEIVELLKETKGIELRIRKMK